MKKVYGTDDGESPCFFYWRTAWKSQRKIKRKTERESEIENGNIYRLHMTVEEQRLE